MKTNSGMPWALALLILASEASYAGPVGPLTTFAAGTQAKASEVNGNFNEVKTAVDDNASRIGTVEAGLTAAQTNFSALQSSVTSLQGNKAGLATANAFTGANTLSNPSNAFTGNGAGLTALNATNLAIGTVPSARLVGTYPGITQVGALGSLDVAGNLTVGGDVNMGSNVMRRMALGTAISTASFQNTVDSITPATGNTITRKDGIVEITTAAQANAVVDLRSNNSSIAWGTPTAGSFLGFRANFVTLAAGQTVYVTYGGPTGFGSQIGGYGFRVSGGAPRTLEGVTFAAGVASPAVVTLNSSFPAGTHSLLAVNNGASIEFYVNGGLLGSLPAAGAGNQIFSTYTVRVENNAATTSAVVGVAFLTLGMPLL